MILNNYICLTQMFEIKNNLIYVEGKETRNPELIGYAILDLVDRLMEEGKENDTQAAEILF